MLTDKGPTYYTETGREEEKLRELILYVSKRCATDPDFGATKLNKILWLADSLSFARRGQPITGVAYMNQKNGPVPRPLKRIRIEMEDARQIAIERRPKGPYVLERPVPLREANLEVFSATDIAFVDELIEILRGHDGTQLSHFSHSCNLGWKLTKLGENIPYEAFMLSDGELSPGMIKRIQECNVEHGWEPTKQWGWN